MIITRRYSSSSNVFNVKSYGAKGTGLIDDTEAIQDAIDAAESAATPGGILYFPKGSYLLRGTAEWRSVFVSAGNITIRGDGVGLSRLVQADAQYPLIGIGADANATGSVLIEHLGFIAAETLTDDGQDLESAKGSLLSVIGDEDNMVRALTVRDCFFEVGMRRCIFLKNIQRAIINECTMQAGASQDHITAAKPTNVSTIWHLFIGNNIYLDENEDVTARVLDSAFGSGLGSVAVHGTAESAGSVGANVFATLSLAKLNTEVFAAILTKDSNGTKKWWMVDPALNTADGTEDVDWFTDAGGTTYWSF
jgi:hypothetical protein